MLSGEYADWRSIVAEEEARQATDYKLDFVLPMRDVYQAAALWGLRRFRQCAICLDQVASPDVRSG